MRVDWCVTPLCPVAVVVSSYQGYSLSAHTLAHLSSPWQSTRIGCLHERRSYSRVHTTPGSNVDTPIAGDTTRSRMASEVFFLSGPRKASLAASLRMRPPLLGAYASRLDRA